MVLVKMQLKIILLAINDACEDGILSVDLPKTENSQRKVIDIN